MASSTALRASMWFLKARRGAKLFPVFLVALAIPYYLFLITNGTFDVFAKVDHELVFNSMLSHLMRGEVTVDPDAIGYVEAFVKDGRTYSYFGITVALLRLPLLVVGDLATTNITVLSMVAATCVSAYFKCASALLIRELPSGNSLRSAIFILLIISILFGGPQIQFLKDSIYQEVICWAMAFNAAFVYFAIRGLLLKTGFSTALLASLSVTAGLAILTRATTGFALYVAMGLLLLSLTARASFAKPSPAQPTNHDRQLNATALLRRLASPQLLLPILILTCFAGVVGLVNYERWGNPLTFADWHQMPEYVQSGRIRVIDEYGEFNLQRLLFGLAYYLFPINFLSRPNGTFLFDEFQQRYFDRIELPPSSIFLTDPLLVILGIGFFAAVIRKPRSMPFNLRHAAALMIGVSVAIFLILIFMYEAFRYRGEFYAFMELAALLGYYTLSQRNLAIEGESSPRLRRLLLYSAVIGVVVSHAELVAYKLSPFGVPKQFIEEGLIRSYYSGFYNSLHLHKGSTEVTP